MISMEAEWFQSPTVTQDGINFLNATQGSSSSLQSPDSRNLRNFPVYEKLERLVYLSEAKWGSQFSSVLLIHSQGQVLEMGQVWGSG